MNINIPMGITLTELDSANANSFIDDGTYVIDCLTANLLVAIVLVVVFKV